MEEIEVPIEKVQEDIHHATHSENSALVSRGALLSAFLAVFAAISALLAGHYSNEAMISQIRSSDEWAHYQAKSIKLEINKLTAAVTKSEAAEEKIGKYKEEQEEIKTEAEKLHKESEYFLLKHETLARAVTFFQIGVALTAIAVLTKKRRYLYFSFILSLGGLVQMLASFFIK